MDQRYCVCCEDHHSKRAFTLDVSDICDSCERGWMKSERRCVGHLTYGAAFTPKAA